MVENLAAIGRCLSIGRWKEEHLNISETLGRTDGRHHIMLFVGEDNENECFQQSIILANDVVHKSNKPKRKEKLN